MLLKYIDTFKESVLSVGDKNKLQKMVQMAWTFVNDRYINIQSDNKMLSCVPISDMIKSHWYITLSLFLVYVPLYRYSGSQRL